MAQKNTDSELLSSLSSALKLSHTITPEPFSVTFSYSDKHVKVTLTNAEDVLKLGEVFAKFLSFNGIENKIETYEL